MVKFKAGLAAACVGLFILTGCGGGDDVATTAAVDAGSGAPVETVKLKMASAFAASLPLLGDGAVEWTETVKVLSGGSLDIKFYEPNALVPGLEAIPAASKGSVEMAWASSGYYAGFNNVFSMFTAVPFGPNATEFLAWYYYGDGSKFADELYGACVMRPIPQPTSRIGSRRSIPRLSLKRTKPQTMQRRSLTTFLEGRNDLAGA